MWHSLLWDFQAGLAKEQAMACIKMKMDVLIGLHGADLVFAASLLD